jgi:predicted DNA-binding transcriptional regulator YafY
MIMAYSRIHRLLKIVTLLQSGKSWDARALAEACGTTTRTIYRDLNMLEGAGIPYFFDPETRSYAIRRDFFMPPVELTLEESLAMICLAEQVGAREQIPFMQAAARAVVKIRSQLPAGIQDRLAEVSPRMEIRLAAATSPDGIADVYQLVRKAIATRRALRCVYEAPRGPQATPQERFVFRPYCLFFSQRAWYAVGQHSGRDGLRCLKLNRFAETDLTDTPYAIPDDFSLKSYLGKAWRMIRGDHIHRIELHFDAAFAETISDTHWHDTQEIEEQGDGSIILRCEVAGLDEIVWWILSMGPHCVVRAPTELAGRVHDLAKATASKYGRVPLPSRQCHPSPNGPNQKPQRTSKRRSRRPAEKSAVAH